MKFVVGPDFETGTIGALRRMAATIEDALPPRSGSNLGNSVARRAVESLALALEKAAGLPGDPTWCNAHAYLGLRDVLSLPA